MIAGTEDEYGDYFECDGNQCSDTWNAYLIKISNEGDVEWERTFSSLDVSNEYYDWAGETIAFTNDGGAIIDIDNGSFGFLKVGDIQNILNNDYKQIRPIDFDLESNYPNPFNPLTTILYYLHNDTMIDLSIYNINGKKVKIIVNGFEKIGYKIIEGNATEDKNNPLAAGVYFYTIQSKDLKETKK